MLLLFCILIAGLVLSVENGLFDTTLSARAQSALNGAIGPRFRAEVGSTVIRFTSDFHLALEARNVDTLDVESGKHVSRADAIRLALDPFSLLRGQIAVSDIEADKVELNAGMLSSGASADFTEFRVDGIPAALENGFSQLDILKQIAERTHTNVIRIAGLSISVPVTGTAPLSLEVDGLEFTRNADGTLHLAGDVTIDGQLSKLSVTAESNGELTTQLRATLSDLALTPFFLKRTEDGAPRQGIEANADVTMSARRIGDAADPAITIGIETDPGNIYADGIQQELRQATIEASYDFSKNSLEILPSRVVFGETLVPFTGAVIDLDRLDPMAGNGYGIDFVVRDGVAAPTGTGEGPLAFDAKATGRYVASTNELTFSELAASSPLGAMIGTLHLRFGDTSPEISFGSRVQKLQTAAVKQLWPYWIASKARRWVLGNVYGGTITNGSIGVFIPAGRLAAHPAPLRLDENELSISFDIDNTRINTTGEIPPIRDTVASFDLKGGHLAVKVKSATAFFASDRSVKIEGGEFAIPSTYGKPLMADLNLNLSGAADAIAELATYKPIAALQRTGFEPKDLSGNVRAKVSAEFGLVSDQKPPAPVWQASLQLTDVNVDKEIGGHKIASLDGTLDVNPKRALLNAKARVNEVPLDIRLVEPVDRTAGVKPERVITGTLSNGDRDLLFPGLKGIVDGPVKIELTRLDDRRQAINADLSRANVSVPWIGWTKGSGIAARARFEAYNDANGTVIDNFQVDGEGFGVKGDLLVNKSGLVSADLSKVKLSASDDFALAVKRSKGGYDVSVRGASVDARPVIARIRAQASGGGAGSVSAASTTIRAKLDKIVGFNGEVLNNADLVYSTGGSKIKTLEFSGMTGSGQAVVSQMANAGGANFIQITSGDAGALSRFMDLYRHMKGGLLNVKLRARDDQIWNGNVDVRNFRLVNEERLQSIVSTPVGQDGRSLNKAVKREIDVSSANFQRGFARLIARNGTLRIENGVVRGEQVGATFQGVLRDANGQMDMTGTFMPAYGLNRLFAELPIIGVILGNGRDRGLLGITFKLSGQFEQPRLTINPLSIIAPGVFRQIFEFQ